MPLFLDVHTMEGGVSAADVAGAHQADVATQAAHGVNYVQLLGRRGRRQDLLPRRGAGRGGGRTRCTARRTASSPQEIYQVSEGE